MATNEGSRLIYSTVQLDLKRKAIRLVAVLPSDQSALISCKFHIQMLQESISYTALSYTWGDASNPMGIVLDGKPFKVRKNLWQFLQKMRQQGSLELFWIDAICIDQENVQERNHQVSLMKDIYSKASQVAFWLGPASANSNLAIEMIKMGPSFHKKGLLPMWTPDEGKALLELCSRSYWKRIRIIQEFL
ncbi:heterokaryon incompatibility protein-domain-containing protein, partial [Hyaloscypha finlandica]